MAKFQISSTYYDEHKKELQFFVGDAIHCTLHCENEPSDKEVDDLCREIEYEQNTIGNNIFDGGTYIQNENKNKKVRITF